MQREKQIFDAQGVEGAIRRMVQDLMALVDSADQLALIGIRTHGVTIARRMHKMLALDHQWDVPLGVIDITLYRDDLDQLDRQPVVRPTQIDFDIEGRTVALVDDVLYTGRTTRCALAEIMDFGRPRAVRLATLVDRGLRELPIQPDIVGVAVETTPEEKVEVRLEEGANLDGVWILRPESSAL